MTNSLTTFSQWARVHPNLQICSPHTYPLWQPQACLLCLRVCFCYVNNFTCIILKYSAHKQYHEDICLSLIYYTECDISRSIRVSSSPHSLLLTE